MGLVGQIRWDNCGAYNNRLLDWALELQLLVYFREDTARDHLLVHENRGI